MGVRNGGQSEGETLLNDRSVRLGGVRMDIIKTNLIMDTWKLLLERDYGMFENMSDVLH